MGIVGRHSAIQHEDEQEATGGTTRVLCRISTGHKGPSPRNPRRPVPARQERESARDRPFALSPFRPTIGRDLDIPPGFPRSRLHPRLLYACNHAVVCRPGSVRRIRLRFRFITSQCDRRGRRGGRLYNLFDVVEIKGFNVRGPVFGKILKPTNSSSGGAISYDVSIS
jgi:hypothetical protein